MSCRAWGSGPSDSHGLRSEARDHLRGRLWRVSMNSSALQFCLPIGDPARTSLIGSWPNKLTSKPVFPVPFRLRGVVRFKWQPTK